MTLEQKIKVARYMGRKVRSFVNVKTGSKTTVMFDKFGKGGIVLEDWEPSEGVKKLLERIEDEEQTK